ncbi:MAG TPA: CAP domain-containing protein [Candidatus Eremiobacteraceae bacterium]|nr:CAP domain-containing protein [Candidatus Eremiobacteraceae bacterium]
MFKVALAFISLVTAPVLAYLAPVPRNVIVLPSDSRPIAVRLMDQINAHRHEYGLAPLEIDPVAQRAAQFQAEDMQANDVMRHADSSGRSPLTRYADFGGRAGMYGENVAYYGDELSELAQQWAAVAKLDGMMMAEKPPQDGHRENILSPNYSAVGIGVAVGPHGIFVAEDFVGRGDIASK